VSRRQKDPLRQLTEAERKFLEEVSHSRSLPWGQVARAKALLAVSEGKSYTQAADEVGYKVGDTIAQWVSRYNKEGLSALEPNHGGGTVTQYGPAEKKRILQEFKRQPDRQTDGTATWSLESLKNALRKAPDGLAKVSTYTIWVTLKEAGYSWQRTESWCTTGKVLRKRKAGLVEVEDPDAEAKKKLIEVAYAQAEAQGIAVYTTDQAGPYQTKPYGGCSWSTQEKPQRQAHEYQPNGTAKVMTLFHPASGKVSVKGVRSCTNEVLHPWLKQELATVLAQLPEVPANVSELHDWEFWYRDLSVSPSRPKELPPLRLLLILDNLTGHKSVEFVLWCFYHGIALLYTPLGGSWLNMTESIQSILKGRALNGCHPKKPEEIMLWFDEVAEHWNQQPTPFEWKGKRWRRRRHQRKQYILSGSGACTRQPIKPWEVIKRKWQIA
jgi:transposase